MGEVAPTQGEVAPTQSEVALTQSEVAPTQSEVAPTQGEVALTQGEVAPTQGEVALTQSEVAPTQGEVAPEREVKMYTKKEYIPKRDDDFFNFQGNLVNNVVTNAVAWSIPAPRVTALSTRRAEYEPLYHKSQDKGNRTQADVQAHKRVRDLYKKEIRAFAKEYLLFNSNVLDEDRRRMRLTVRDLEPTPRGKISSSPIIGLRALDGGSIEVRARVTTDQTRFSMHPLADGIECRWTLVPKGEMPPEDPDASGMKTLVSKKARFTVSCGVKNAGDTFYGFFRWVNITRPDNSGDWTSKPKAVVIA